MTLNRGRLNWGVFFIVLGAVALANDRGVISTSTLAEAWRFWPLILVGIGLGIVLYRTPAAFVGGLVVAACFGLIAGSLLSVGPQLSAGCSGDVGNPTRSLSRDGSFSGSARVELHLDCGSANITPSTDASWHVRTTSSGNGNVSVEASQDSLVVRSGSEDGWFWNRGHEHWDISLPSGTSSLSTTLNAGDANFRLAGITIGSASFSVNAGSLHLDLSGARVTNMNVSTNAGSTSLILDGASSVSGNITTNAGATEVCAPAGLGLRLSSNGNLSSDNFGSSGLVLVGGAWQTPNYDTAPFKADLWVRTSLGSVELNPAGGCK